MSEHRALFLSRMSLLQTRYQCLRDHSHEPYDAEVGHHRLGARVTDAPEHQGCYPAYAVDAVFRELR